MFLTPMARRKGAGGPRGRRCEDELILVTSPSNEGFQSFSSAQLIPSMLKPSSISQKVSKSKRKIKMTKNGGEAGYVSLGSSLQPLLDPSQVPSEASEVSVMVQTATGRAQVVRQGNPKLPAILTYPDIGLDHKANFQNFFNCPEMRAVKESFCFYHVHAPGQEAGAEKLADDIQYPSMEELSEQIEYIIHFFGIPTCIGFGCGLGANVLVRAARRRPTMFEGLILINCTCNASGWVEWAYHKVNIKSLKKVESQLPDGVIEYLVWYHFGRMDAPDRCNDLLSHVSRLKQHFSSNVHPKNLSLLLESYVSRNPLGLAREIASNGKSILGASKSLRMPVLNMTGDFSPHVDATVALNGKLQPDKCTWIKFQDAGLILEEQPAKVAEATKLFFQGLGYVLRSRIVFSDSSPEESNQADRGAKETSASTNPDDNGCCRADVDQELTNSQVLA